MKQAATEKALGPGLDRLPLHEYQSQGELGHFHHVRAAMREMLRWGFTLWEDRAVHIEGITGLKVMTGKQCTSLTVEERGACREGNARPDTAGCMWRLALGKTEGETGD